MEIRNIDHGRLWSIQFSFCLFGNVLGLIPIFDLTGLIGKIGYKAEMLGKDNILYLLSKGGHTVTANVNVLLQ